MSSLIIGKSAVSEALEANSSIDRILISFTAQKRPDVYSLVSDAKRKGIKVQTVAPKQLDSITENAPSQGIVAYLSDVKNKSLDNIIDQMDDYPIVLVLDHIEDPYNFGAILRTTEALGVKAVVYPKDRNSQMSPGVIKTSTGAHNWLDLIKVVNITQSIEKLRKAGYWIYGSDVNTGDSIHTFEPQFPCVFIVGNESKGVAFQNLKKAHNNLHIPLRGHISSLNVSVATGIVVEFLTRKYSENVNA